MLRRWVGIAAALVILAGILAPLSAPPASAAAPGSCWNEEGNQVACDVVIGDDGDGPTAGPPVVGPADFTPGPTSCTYTRGAEPVEVECSTSAGHWSNSDQCYWSLLDPQRDPPSGQSSGQGAWYQCSPPEIACATDSDRGAGGYCAVPLRWLVSPPPGVTQYTPGQAAGILARQFVLAPIEIGMAPESAVHADDPPGTAPYRRTWVGIPVWAWVGNPDSPESWGPNGATGTFGGQTITATARVTHLIWSTGDVDGQQVSCGAGTFFDINYWASRAIEDSPTCGWRFQKTGTHTVTATTYWVVEWTGGGESGQFRMPTTTASTTVQVGELQSVNVRPPKDTNTNGNGNG